MPLPFVPLAAAMLLSRVALGRAQGTISGLSALPLSITPSKSLLLLS
jgi:hypothetical protein